MAGLMVGVKDGAKTLRDLLLREEPLLAPGAYDALSARLIEDAGFPAVYMSGFGAAASLLGRPDVGLLTLTEMADQARRIVNAVAVPVIADADTGYGNPINVIRTVKEYERAGVAGIQLEDQVSPKKCGHMADKDVIPAQEMVAKIRAAVDARSTSLIIIARTDARAVEGLPRALERAYRYYEAGADVLFVEAPENEEEIREIARTFPDVPLVFNWAEGGKTPPLAYEEIRALGFKVIIFPIGTLLSATQAIRDLLAIIRDQGTPRDILGRLIPFSGFLDFIGLLEVRKLEARYRVAENGSSLDRTKS